MKKKDTMKLRLTSPTDECEDFPSIEVEYTPNLDTRTIEEEVSSEVCRFRDCIVAFAREAYLDYGRGYVYITAECSAASLSHTSMSLNKAQIKYLTLGAENDRVFGHTAAMPDYNPQAEAVFVVMFYDGFARGVVGLDKAATTPKPSTTVSEAQGKGTA
jgi:hypothetical protein